MPVSLKFSLSTWNRQQVYAFLLFLSIGSEYYNYKKFHSIILMAVCDAKYRFLLVDVGAYGREGGRNVFATSHIAHCLKNGSLGLPNPCRLPYSDKGTPHYFNADDAFPLLENMMKPFGGRNTGTLEIQRKIFNLRLAERHKSSFESVIYLSTRIFLVELLVPVVQLKTPLGY